ncbi:MAG: Capsular polysaccharide biosynthesis protein [Berkelbacteria bacterium GW2011_GWA1_36_9]|uniref:Capsular polysaccharide biosynthesis protein n=1 Tax=Berkelbacteria bacterium GW2011_GWA1_36_9 TaxID=1618331 RepID=A0A0G0IR12_9BACT|nr:MAG: Capsular polysaccharide biosynthesis protein [Berkelbacteria bacterium GW2011_GWA1_36_9]
MILGSNFYNGGQFVYHFITGRMLGKANYSDLAAFISVLGIFSVILGTLNMTVVKFIAGEKDTKKVRNFIKWSYFWAIWISLIVSLLLLASGPVVTNFLNITQPAVFYFLPFVLLFYVLTFSGRSILQGLCKFNQYVVSLLAESAIKIVVSFVLIFLGYALFGAMAGFLAGVIISFIVVRLTINKYLQGPKGPRPALLPLVKYSSSVFVQAFAQTSMYSADLMLVKHFFSPDQAGIYASLSVLARIVFFGATPVIQVMFPMIAKRHAQNAPFNKILNLSMLMVVSFSILLILIFSLFPNIVIEILYGEGFLGGGSMLWWFGLFMAILALASLLTQYFLSINKTKAVWIFAIAAALQVILIWFIHSTLLIVIQISILSATLLVATLLLYFSYQYFHDKTK